MAANGTLGSKLSISDSAIAESIDSEGEFTALDWIEVGLVESFGEFGRVFAPVNFQAIADGRMYKLKGGFDDGNLQMVVGQDLGDDGQLAMYDAANLSTQDNYGFKIELNDAGSGGGPTTFFFRGLVMSYRTQMGSVNSVVKAATTIEVNSTILHLDPAEIYDRFITGSSLAAYHLFNGSDAEAVDPVISGDALVAVSGNATAADFATNGSELITDTGFTLSGGAIVVESRVKLSAITNVGFFFGVTDQKVALEVPIESSGSSNAITTNATDGVGFMFDTNMGTDNIWFVGVNNNIDESSQNSAQAFVANTYKTLRLEIAANGDAVFKIDGVVVGSTMTTACRTSVALYPVLAVSARGAASRTLTADYLYARQD